MHRLSLRVGYRVVYQVYVPKGLVTNYGKGGGLQNRRGGGT